MFVFTFRFEFIWLFVFTFKFEYLWLFVFTFKFEYLWLFVFTFKFEFEFVFMIEFTFVLVITCVLTTRFFPTCIGSRIPIVDRRLPIPSINPSFVKSSIFLMSTFRAIRTRSLRKTLDEKKIL